MILVVNCGSQSIKWKLFDKNLNIQRESKKEVFDQKKYQKFLTEEFRKLNDIKDKIKVIGHRVVHGGKFFRKPVIITEKILKKLEKFNDFAPLHNPFNLLGVKMAKKFFPKTKQIAFFDTEFYKNLPERTIFYPLPEKIRKEFPRLGFHGISHEYACKKGAEVIKKPFSKLKIISCHLGGGSSITAIRFGKVVDTSMGFTPLEGLMMMTRAGSIDPGVILELEKRFSFQEIKEILNFQSGIKGITGFSDMRKVLKKKSQKTKFALDIYVYQIQKYIGSYFTILGGCDLLIFTGTIGWGSSRLRKLICKNLKFLLKNTKILAIKPNEELAIAEKLKKII